MQSTLKKIHLSVSVESATSSAIQQKLWVVQSACKHQVMLHLVSANSSTTQLTQVEPSVHAIMVQ